MRKKSLGMIETWGYVAAVEALDAGMKAAQVTCSGYAITPSARVSIRFAGDVAAVTAAVKAGVAAAGRVGQVIAWHVIARPDPQLGRVIENAPGGDPPLIPPEVPPPVQPVRVKDPGSGPFGAMDDTPAITALPKTHRGRSALIRKTDGKPVETAAVSPKNPVRAKRKTKKKTGADKPGP